MNKIRNFKIVIGLALVLAMLGSSFVYYLNSPLNAINNPQKLVWDKFKSGYKINSSNKYVQPVKEITEPQIKPNKEWYITQNNSVLSPVITYVADRDDVFLGDSSLNLYQFIQLKFRRTLNSYEVDKVYQYYALNKRFTEEEVTKYAVYDFEEGNPKLDVFTQGFLNSNLNALMNRNDSNSSTKNNDSTLNTDKQIKSLPLYNCKNSEKYIYYFTAETNRC